MVLPKFNKIYSKTCQPPAINYKFGFDFPFYPMIFRDSLLLYVKTITVVNWAAGLLGQIARSSVLIHDVRRVSSCIFGSDGMELNEFGLEHRESYI